MKQKNEYMLIQLACIAIGLDLIVTLSAWHLESNSIVIQLGMINFTIIKLLMIISIPIVMFVLNARIFKLAWYCVWFILVFHLIIVVSNLWVVSV